VTLKSVIYAPPTASEKVFFRRNNGLMEYIANHAKEAAMMKSTPLPDSPRLMMALVGPVIGVVSGLVLGVFGFVAGKFVKPGLKVIA
jgi:hypothetical protein